MLATFLMFQYCIWWSCVLKVLFNSVSTLFMYIHVESLVFEIGYDSPCIVLKDSPSIPYELLIAQPRIKFSNFKIVKSAVNMYHN